ncbi:MAG: translocation/assembly module TamB domain-containing protein [Nitrospiria bacterium]
MRKKITFVFSLIILFLLTANLLFRGGFFSESLKKFVVGKMGRELHSIVTVGNMRLNLFPAFLILDDVELKGESKDATQVLKSKQIFLSFSPWSLLTEFFLIHKIQLQDPEIHLIWNREGTNFDFLKRSFLQSGTAGQKSPVIIQKLILINGALILDQNMTNHHVEINHIEIKTDTDPTMTFFQIVGSAKGISYQSDHKVFNTVANLDWKFSMTPKHIEIKRFSLSVKETSVTVKGIINFPIHQNDYPFKLDSDFHLSTETLVPGSDSLAGHGLFVGIYNGEKQINGSLSLSHLTLDKDKTTHRVGEIKSHFSFEPGLFFLDHISSELFGGRIEGKLKFRMNASSTYLETDYTLHDLSLSRPTLLLYPQYKKYTEGKTLDASGSLKIINMDLHQLNGSGHFHMTGIPRKVLSPRDMFWENGTKELTLADTDYEFHSSTFFFRDASLQIGSSLITGNGFIQRGGGFSTSLALKSENGGEIISWLGYSQWSGAVEFTGEARGTVSSPVIEGKGIVSRVLFNNHSLGDGSAQLKYSGRRLEMTNVEVIKGTGNYTGHGIIEWKSSKEFAYQIQTDVSKGAPDDIIRIFVDDVPLFTQATGTAVIAGDHQKFNLKGSFDLESGTLYDETFDKGHVELEITDTDMTLERASLIHGTSAVSGKGKISFNGNYEGEMKSENFHLENLVILSKWLPDLQGTFTGILNGNGTLKHPQLKLNGTFQELFFKHQKLGSGSILLSLQDKDLQTHVKLDEHSLTLDGSINLATPFISKIDIQGEDIPLENFLPQGSDFQSTSFNGAISGKIGVEGPLKNPGTLNVSAHLSKLTANLSGYEITNQGEIAFNLIDGKLNIDSCQLKGEGTTLSIAGGADLFKQYRLFITGEADLSLLKALKKEITYGEGKAYLALSIYDNWNDPKFQGGLTVQDGQIRTTFVSQRINISSLGLFFNERQVFLESLDVELGEGNLHIAGKIDVNHFKMGHFGLILEAKESPFSLLPGWEATISGSLIYQGDLAVQNLQGELTLSHSVYNKKIDFRSFSNEFNKFDANKKPFPLIGQTRLNIRLRGDQDLRIENNIARLPYSIDLTLKGTIDSPVLIGRIEADSGFIYYYNKTFEVISISVDFIDPETIKPLIDLKAKTQIIGKDRTTYQIDLGLTGTPEEFNRTLTSDDPTLTETDILALILAGRKASEVSTDPSSQQQIGGQFVPLVIESPLEGLLEDITGVNSLSIEPTSPGIRTTGGPRVNLEQRLLKDKLLLNYSYTINPSQDQVIQMDYLINRYTYLQGSRDELGNVGGNLKFRFEFK